MKNHILRADRLKGKVIAYGLILLGLFCRFPWAIADNTKDANDSGQKSTSSSYWPENLGRIYKDDSNKLIQEFWLLGRYQGQYHFAEGGTSDNDGFETRRLRLGTQTKFFNKLTLHAQMVSGSDVNPFYNGFSELWARWAFAREVELSIGQQKNRFTHDRNVSSRYINYLERAAITNMFNAEYTPAVTLQGKISGVEYYTGFFSNFTERNIGNAFVDLNSGYSFIGASYYKLEDFFGTDSSYLYGSYIHSDSNDSATNLNKFKDGLSSALIFTKGSFGFVNEITGGFGSDTGNVLGINVQPSYFFTDSIQVVTRYQLALSSDNSGISGQGRYERESGLDEGGHYNAGYLGVNYYIFSHLMKIMLGTEYSSLGGKSVLTTSAMLRIYFGPHSGGPFPMNQTLPGANFEYD